MNENENKNEEQGTRKIKQKHTIGFIPVQKLIFIMFGIHIDMLLSRLFSLLLYVFFD